jgi:signal transduction histidine kinase
MEKNLSKVIILTFIVIMSSMIFAISYFYVNNTYDNFDSEMDKFVQEYYSIKKKTLKKEINTVLDILDYNSTKSDLSKEDLKNYAIGLLNNITFEENKSNYFFVYEIKDINGGDNFAKLIVNPNRPDLVGELISTNYEDIDGKKFREIFLTDIRKTSESFTEYAYKKPDSNEVKHKLSYFKYYEKLNWIIAVGIYTDDVENEIAIKRKDLQKRIKDQVVQNVVLFLMFLSIAILVSIVISQKIDDILKKYENKVRLNSKELEELNQSLENKVKEEIEKNREKEQIYKKELKIKSYKMSYYF